MIWHDGELTNPMSGNRLERDTPHSLRDLQTGERFPIIAEIPFLRVNREDLIEKVLHSLDNNDERAALILLFQDQDDWAKTPPPETADLLPLFENRELTLRGAMKHLQYGAVADYFTYRWSDPTFLSGLALLENHLPLNAANVFELCCGIGHYLREFEMRGIAAIGADVVFSKLWLARKFVAPTAKLICFDANKSFPQVENFCDASFCHDAFYFLPEKQNVVNEFKRIAENTIIIGHAHNAEADNFSSGAPLTVPEYAAFFDNPILYDDKELTESVIANRHPQARSAEDLHSSAAVAVVQETAEFAPLKSERKSFALPLAGNRLQLNPLLDGGGEILSSPQYPSERYRDEYAELSNYLELNNESISFAERAKAFDGDWKDSPQIENFVRRRIFLDLPEKW